jgi:hypothetical protein
MDVLLCADISSTNQYVELLCDAYQRNGHNVILGVNNFLYSNFMPDLVHLQWPEALYKWNSRPSEEDKKLQILQNSLTKYSINNAFIVTTIHNVLPHDNYSAFYKNVYKTIINYSDLLIHHGKASISILKNFYSNSINKRHIVCPHGPYPYEYVNSNRARLYYKIPESKYVFLNFGLQRPYKGGDFINNVFDNWKSEAFLFTIGPKIYLKKKGTSLEKLKVIFKKQIAFHFGDIKYCFSKNKKTVFKSVPQSEIPRIIAASDIFFLGHRNGLNSGLLSLAASYGKPVVFPDLGNFKEQLNGWPWQISYKAGNIQSAIFSLEAIIDKVIKYEPGKIVFDNTEWLKNNSWDEHVQKIINEKYK